MIKYGSCLGFTDMLQIKKTQEYSVYTAVEEKSGNKVFIKIAESEKTADFIKREFENQVFLSRLSDFYDCGFIFLEPELRGRIIIYPDITQRVEWLGQTSPEKYCYKPKISKIEEYINQVILLQKALFKVSFEQLPGFIKNDWNTRKSRMGDNLRIDSNILREHGLISKEEQKKSFNLLSENNIEWNYQHHDLVPWHMGRMNDGTYVLIDSGWAGWSLRYYDFAYFALQMIGYASSEIDADIMLGRAEKEFENDPCFFCNMQKVLIYRGTRLARELVQVRQFEQGAKDVIKYLRKCNAYHA